MESFKTKVETASSEIQHLKDAFLSKEAKLNEIKKKQSGMKEIIQEIHQLKGNKQQLIANHKQALQDLGTERKGLKTLLKLLENT